jgi:2',3'-cyclic-nucleotide 2'-phosphodiesterase (5'-nucleotidase family)
MALLLMVLLVAACSPNEAVETHELVDGSMPESAAVLDGKVAQAPTRAIPVQLTILHTNDVRGAVDPCG